MTTITLLFAAPFILLWWTLPKPEAYIAAALAALILLGV